MKLFSPAIYSDRRNALLKEVKKGLIIFIGNNEAPMNYADNHYRFRQDSSFMYFFGLKLPKLEATLDTSTGEVCLYGDDFSVSDVIWMGPQPKMQELAEKVGVSKVKSYDAFGETLNKYKGEIHYLPPYRFETQIKLSEYLGYFINKVPQQASKELIRAVVSLRERKAAEEIEQMTEAVNISGEMHKAAMKAVKSGKYEYEVVAKIYEMAKSHNSYLSYPAICTINGQTLHNHYHGNILEKGRLFLNDSGAENEMCYSGDITRTVPVNGVFSDKQKDIYTIVLKMLEDCTSSLKPGLKYQDCHIEANRIMLAGLKELGLVHGDVDEMTTAGVGGLFMPHGLGHQIGMDVHDMEDLGESLVGYDPHTERGTQMGLKSLRLGKALGPNFVVTVEPGIYFIPDLLEQYKAEGTFSEFVNYEKLKAYYDFGGIRIEDDVLVTQNGPEVLGNTIPKTIEEIEHLMQS